MRKSLTAFAFSLFIAGLSSAQDSVPSDFELVRFSGPEITPSPAALCAAPTGEVFVAVDLNGSLGKGPDKGRIVRLIDTDKDGVADSHTIFAKADSARGLISVGKELFVLHTTYDAASGEASGMDLTLFVDEDWDGVADGPGKTLIKGICSPESIRSRGTDHSTNGIRLGIDGWIYIAVGDFGFSEARGTDGTTLTLLGGGIVRVRPDGSEMELYTKGLRNIYDVAIDPFMNIFTRGNTNDGGGWNVRFIHQIQSADYGYPSLFINFAQEILPALEDLGGGSGTGALFLDEPTWPKAYNHQPLMSDWGRNAVFLHRLVEDGPSFTQTAESFIQLSQVSDLDVDASGQMFLSAWAGATYRGSAEKGYIVRVVPKGWEYQAFESLDDAKIKDLIEALASPSSTIRLSAQQELLTRANKTIPSKLLDRATDDQLDLEARVAALYTYAQMAGPEGIPALMDLTGDSDLAEFATRAATDRLPWIAQADISSQKIERLLANGSPREKAAAAVALGRLGKSASAFALLQTPYAFPDTGEATAPVAKPVLIKGANSVQAFEADITGYQELHLNALYYNTGSKKDRAYWLNPTIELENGNALSLLELDWFSANTEHGPVEKVRDLSATGLQLKPKTAKNVKGALAVPAVSTVVFKLPRGVVAFKASVTMEESLVKDDRPGAEFLATPSPMGGRSPRSMNATPDAARILPHLSAHSLVGLGNEEALLGALGSPSSDLAHWAIRYSHSESMVDGVLEHLRTTEYPTERRKTLTTLARLYQKEAPYDGSWWWTTRPDTRGPYYKPIKWEASPRIEAAFLDEWNRADAAGRATLTQLNDSHRMGIEKLGTFLVKEEEEEVNVDLAKIASKKGAIATTPIEDVLLSLDKIKGDLELGETLFTQQGCIACHTLDNSSAAKGPFMGQIGSIMQRDQIAEAILRPNATISQGFQTTIIVTKDGTSHVGFVTSRNSDEITLRDMAGLSKTVAVSKIEKEDHLPTSMMPPGLANSMSLEEFASLVAFLSAQK